jgi:hypothetical protein
MVGNSPAAGQFGVVSVIVTSTPAVVLEVDLVDQAELVDVGRDFRIEHRLQRGDDFGSQPLGLLGRQRRLGFHVGGFDFGCITHENNSRALISACARWSTSSRVLYIPKRRAAGGCDIEPL